MTVRPAKPGRGGWMTLQPESSQGDPAGNKPRLAERASGQEGVLRGGGMTHPAKHGQRAIGIS
jgi:hypothetical protein